MDIISHAIAGYAAGYAAGNPVGGMIAGIAPDMVLPLRRIAEPPVAYNITHSLTFILSVGALCYVLSGSLAVMLGLLSHLLLDIPVHGKIWAPPLLFPFKQTRFSPFGLEWEWFNDIWWVGCTINILWCILCVQLSRSPTGFP